MLWVLIRIASVSEAILMSTHNIGFYEDFQDKNYLSNIIKYHQICTFNISSSAVVYGSETHLREVPIYVKSRIVTS